MNSWEELFINVTKSHLPDAENKKYSVIRNLYLYGSTLHINNDNKRLNGSSSFKTQVKSFRGLTVTFFCIWIKTLSLWIHCMVKIWKQFSLPSWKNFIKTTVQKYKFIISLKDLFSFHSSCFAFRYSFPLSICFTTWYCWLLVFCNCALDVSSWSLVSFPLFLLLRFSYTLEYSSTRREKLKYYLLLIHISSSHCWASIFH